MNLTGIKKKSIELIYRTKPIISGINKQHFVGVITIFIIALIVTLSNLGWTKEFVGDDAGVAAHYSDTHLELASNMWDSYTFPGRSNVIASTGMLHVTLINLLHKVGLTSIIIDRLFYFLILFIPGLGIYFLASEICSKLFSANETKIAVASITAAIFYMLNNFTMILLSFPPTSYIYSYMLLPWIFLLYLKDYHVSADLSKKLIFSLLFLLILSGNPSNTISVLALVLFYDIFFRKDNKIINNWKNFLQTFIIILLFSSYIFLPTLGNKGNPYNISNDDIAPSILYNSTLTSIGNLFRFLGHPAQASYVFNEFLTNSFVTNLNYILLGIASLFMLRIKIRRKEIFLLLTFLLFLFLAKSVHQPWAEANRWIYEHIPLFGMYRASYFKFIYFAVFAFSILLSVSLLRVDEFTSKIKFLSIFKWIIWALCIFIVVYGAKPFFDGIVAAKIHKTKIPSEYHDLNIYFKDIKTDFSILALPQLPSGLTLDWGNGNYYGGGANPEYFLFGRPTWSNGWFLPENMTSNQFNLYKKMLTWTNVRYVFLHKDIPEKYSFEVDINGNLHGQTNFDQINARLTSDKDFKLIQDNKFFKVFEISHDKYQPHFYIPSVNDISETSLGSFLKDDSATPAASSSAAYFKGQNALKEDGLTELKKLESSENNSSSTASTDKRGAPVLEYKKITANKYRLVVHGVSRTFPLVFSEGYHDGWKVYLNSLGTPSANLPEQLSKYKILEKNGDSQATREEIADYITKGSISTLGRGKSKEARHLKWADGKERLDYLEKYNIEFISKNFQGTIQNDNLSNGAITETLLKKNAVPDDNHLMANGYANGWIIDPGNICSGNQKCIKNSDGTYDIELILEFAPQRLFYLGVFLFTITILFISVRIVCLKITSSKQNLSKINS